MINTEERNTLKDLINKAFTQFNENKRELMLEELCNIPNAYTVFCQYNGNRIAKIGVRFKVGSISGKHYFSTEYDNELLDL